MSSPAFSASGALFDDFLVDCAGARLHSYIAWPSMVPRPVTAMFVAPLA